eukprot:1145339-Pelagomonas_calceolata.AAC.1
MSACQRPSKDTTSILHKADYTCTCMHAPADISRLFINWLILDWPENTDDETVEPKQRPHIPNTPRFQIQVVYGCVSPEA